LKRIIKTKKGTQFNKEQHDQFLDKMKKLTKKNEKMRSHRIKTRKQAIKDEKDE